MKLIVPLAMTAMFGLAAAASAATPTAAAPATAQPVAVSTAKTPASSPAHQACAKEADAKHLKDKARHEFFKECMAGKKAPAASEKTK